MVERARSFRRAVSHRVVWAGLVGLGALVLGTFVVGYWVFVRYERKVLRQLPVDTHMALRLDVEQVVLYEPVRKHIFPVLDGRTDSGEPLGRLTRFEQLADVNLGMDLREVAVAIRQHGWLVLVGGLFPQSGLVEVLGKVVDETAPELACRLLDARLTCGSGVNVAQATNGVLLFGSDQSIVDSGLKGSTWARSNGMTEESALSAVALARGTNERTVAFTSMLLGARWLSQVTSVAATATLGELVGLRVAINGVSKVAPDEVTETLNRLQAVAADAPGPDWAGERSVLARARAVQVAGQPVLESEWTRAEVDRAAAALADWLKLRLTQ